MGKYNGPAVQGRPVKGSQRHFIRQWRMARGWNIPQLADRAGMSGAALSMLEVGRARYSQKSLEALAEALDVEPWHLLAVNPEEIAWAPFITGPIIEGEEPKPLEPPTVAVAYVKSMLDRYAKSGKK